MPRTPRPTRPLLPALTAVVAGALAAALMVPTAPASAEPDVAAPTPVDVPDAADVADVDEATQALEVAEDLLTGSDGSGDGNGDGTGGRGTTAPEEEISATLALRDLAFSARALSGRDRARAESLLARPTDKKDQFGDGYVKGTPVQRACATDVCLHWVTTTRDAPGAGFTPARALEVAQDVHTHHVDQLGWRAPLPDGSRGGNDKFDIYLADIGSQGLYGYCAPDDTAGSQHGKRTVAYCVLDNDYDEAAFRQHTPDENLRVTMAHEYLHAIQYNYDATEDGWLFEATATWMEEVYADDVNDNRQYLPAGQLRRPRAVLDAFNFGAQSVYANWIFFEHLANRYGRGVVRAVWERAGAYSGAPDLASVPAVARTLSARKSSLRAAYARFAADNTVPGRTPYYPEGGEWGLKASPVKTVGLTRSRRASSRIEVRLDHLSSGTVAVRSTGLGSGTRLRVAVDGPPGASSPAVFALVHRKDGTLGRRFVPLNGPSGAKTVSFPFASGQVSKVTLTLVNASQRYRCNRGTDLSCAGTSMDDRRLFTVRASALD